MAITSDSVRKIFKGLENGDGAAFFEHVDDNVDWIVEGTIHSLVTIGARKRSWREPSQSWDRFSQTARSSMWKI